MMGISTTSPPALAQALRASSLVVSGSFATISRACKEELQFLDLGLPQTIMQGARISEPQQNKRTYSRKGIH